MSGNWFLSKQEKSYRWKKIVLKWGTSHTLGGCSRAGWTSPRSSQRSFSSGSPLRISALGNLHPTKNKWRQNQVGKRQNRKPNSAYLTWRVFAVSCDTWELFASEPLHSRRGVCALRGLLGNRNKHVITADLSTTQQSQTGPSLSPLTCCIGSFLWSCFCRTPAVLPAASFPRRPPGWTWGFAPGSRDDLCFERHQNGAQPKTLEIKSGVSTRMLYLKMAEHNRDTQWGWAGVGLRNKTSWYMNQLGPWSTFNPLFYMARI